MKKIDEKVLKEIDLSTHEYYVTQTQIKGQIKVLTHQRNMAIYFAIFIILLSFGLCFKALLISQESKKVDKIVYKEDGFGGITYVGVVNSSILVNQNKYLANQLSEYLYALYTVPNDNDTKQRNVTKVQLMTEINYYENVKKVIKDSYSLNQKITVKISVVSKLSQNLYQIDWDKFVDNNLQGSFKTLLSFKQVETKDEDQLILQYNPLNLVITNVQTDQRIKTEGVM